MPSSQSRCLWVVVGVSKSQVVIRAFSSVQSCCWFDLLRKKFLEPASLTATIDDVKAEIRQRLDVPPGQQRLIFRGQPLEDSKTLLENEITDGACIVLDVMWPIAALT